MAFNLERLFVDVFAPRPGDIVTVMYDLPHGEIRDREEWQLRREMASAWHRKLGEFAHRYGFTVKPIVTYQATGAQNSDLPADGMSQGQAVRLEDIIKGSTIVVCMPEFSASAPLFMLTKKCEHLRVASMPGVTKSMEETGLAADYREIAATCKRLAGLFDRADGVEVTFSTGHTCHFDLSDHKRPFRDDGMLPPDAPKDADRLRNLPSGEVGVCPNEAGDSRTAGEIPAVLDSEEVVFIVKHNRIVDVKGKGPVAERMRAECHREPALCNIAEVAIGCNDKAAVTGNVLEDEKAGFHWAYGRSEFLRGTVGPKHFSSPDKVCHQDIVYAKGNPIVCSRFDFVIPDGSRRTAIVDGVLIV
jgi:leucyl aminopeptidase (aminopeptidase T)